jgi:hypothetical protein
LIAEGHVVNEIGERDVRSDVELGYEPGVD